MIRTLTCLLLLLPFGSFAQGTCCQNIIPNGSFEINSGIPSGVGSWTLAESWTNASSNNSSYGSPDYFYLNEDMPDQSSLPNNNFSSNVFPVDGNAVMGMAVYFQPGTLAGTREYIAVSFNCALEVGKEYRLQFYLTQGTPQNQGFSVDRLGVQLSAGPAYQTAPVIEAEPQLIIDEVFQDSVWREITYDFVADQPYDFLVFGCFGSEINAVPIYANSVPYSYAYYFVDDFSLREIGPDTEIDLPLDSLQGICDGETLSIEAPYENGNYEWSTGETTPEILVTEAGTYALTVTDECKYGEASVIVNVGSDTTIIQQETICAEEEYVFEGDTLNTSGTYSVVLERTSGCDSLITLELTVRPPANDTLQLSICESETYTLNDSSYTQAGTYVQNFPAAASSGCDSALVLELTVVPIDTQVVNDILCPNSPYEILGLTFEQAGTYSQFITEVPGGGCPVQLELQLEAIEAAVYPTELNLLKGTQAPLELEIENLSNLTKVSWFPSLYLSCADCLMPLVAASVSTSYEVELIDEFGCAYQTEVQVNVTDDLGIFMPNAFSPNDDGFNDRFFPFGKSAFVEQVNYLQIYNRWGNLLYEVKNFVPEDAGAGWNGQWNGQEMPTGVYIYQMEVQLNTQQNRLLKGQLHLIR